MTDYVIINADHPHSDPGDGRSECETCGKWIWLASHSCKGVPVTDAAMERWTARYGMTDKAIPSTPPPISFRHARGEVPDTALGRCQVMLQCHRETGHAGGHEAAEVTAQP